MCYFLDTESTEVPTKNESFCLLREILGIQYGFLRYLLSFIFSLPKRNLQIVRRQRSNLLLFFSFFVEFFYGVYER